MQKKKTYTKLDFPTSRRRTIDTRRSNESAGSLALRGLSVYVERNKDTERKRKQEEIIYAQREKAKRETLLYYFDDSWFDDEYIRSTAISRGKLKAQHTRDMRVILRCPRCYSYWGKEASDSSTRKVVYHPNRVFGGIPCDKKLCLHCEEAVYGK